MRLETRLCMIHSFPEKELQGGGERAILAVFTHCYKSVDFPADLLPPSKPDSVTAGFGFLR